MEGSIFTSLRGGMGSLVDALVSALPKNSLRVGTPARAIRAGDPWKVNDEEFSALLLTTAAHESAKLLAMTDGELSTLLGEFPFTDALSVTFVYDRAALNELPGGFGFLVPKDEQRGILACTFVHQKWPQKVPANKAVLRIFMTTGLDRDDASITAIARQELQSLLGVTAVPERVFVHRWPQAMPQYIVGHMDKIKRITALCAQSGVTQSGVTLAGNAYRGIGVSHCVGQGQEAAQRISARIRP